MQAQRRLDASRSMHHRVPANDDVSRQLWANRTAPCCSGNDGISRHLHLKYCCCWAFCYGFLRRWGGWQHWSEFICALPFALRSRCACRISSPQARITDLDTQPW